MGSNSAGRRGFSRADNEQRGRRFLGRLRRRPGRDAGPVEQSRLRLGGLSPSGSENAGLAPPVPQQTEGPASWRRARGQREGTPQDDESPKRSQGSEAGRPALRSTAINLSIALGHHRSIAPSQKQHRCGYPGFMHSSGYGSRPSAGRSQAHNFQFGSRELCRERMSRHLVCRPEVAVVLVERGRAMLATCPTIAFSRQE
jgi:hypothetical protein